MSGSAPGIFISFIAGVLSFLTPCVLPLVPGYISFMSKQSLKDLRSAKGIRRLNPHVLLTSLSFILGFSVVFIAFGAAASALGQTLASYKHILIRAGGVIIIILGLHVAGVFKLMSLYKEKRMTGPVEAGGPIRAFLLGLAFAFGWTPCIGPILGGILTLALSEDTLSRGVMLLVFYSAGLAVPFLLTAILIDEFFKVFNRIKNHFRKIEIGAGVLLVIMGLFMVLNQFELAIYYIQKILPEFLLRVG
jgi:cytochrome c-type biogenesis protein